MKGANEFLIVSGKHLFGYLFSYFNLDGLFVYLLGCQFRDASHFAI